MLVEPAVGRNDDAAFLPLVLLNRRPFRPEKRVAFSSDNDDVGPGAVSMGLLVRTDGELGDMSGHGVFGEFKHDVSSSGATLARFL